MTYYGGAAGASFMGVEYRRVDRDSSITVVIPVFNEEATIRPLIERIDAVLAQESRASHSILLVDDGSTDATWERVQSAIAQKPGRIRALRLRRNFGKSDALAIGFLHCDADIVITMDGDLQDDPAEIPKFLHKLDEGYDLVSGWKQRRRDPLSKRLPSRLFNFITSRITKVPLHDFNCGFKAYRTQVVKALRIQGEMHRFIPVIAAHLGFRVGEVTVNHLPREHGTSKFGSERYIRGLLDLFTVLATTRYLKRPGHLFGGLGVLVGLAGLVPLVYLTFIWALDLGAIGQRPLLFFGIMCILLAAQLISLGIVAELSLSRSRTQPDELQVRESLGFPGST